MNIAPDAADPPATAEPTDPWAGLTPGQLVEEALCDACAAALVLAERVALWHFAGRPTLFDGTEPELQAAMVAMADRLLTHGPVAAARSLADVMPPDLWLTVEDLSDDPTVVLPPEAA